MIKLSSNTSSEEHDEILDTEVFSFMATFPLSEYADKLSKGIFIKPEFQRNSIWDTRTQSRFIESLLFDYPIPQVFLFKEKDKENYLIIDGYQRISTIFSFLNDGFRLKNVASVLNDKLFSDLPYQYKEKLLARQLSACIIRQIDPNNIQTLYNIFERLNTGGQNLNNMEVRRAVNYGPLIQTLEKLNKDENWRKILSKKEISKRFTDMELILRLMAFYDNWDEHKNIVKGYMTSIKPFLNEYCHKNKNNSKIAFQEMFLKTTAKIVEVLPKKPFTLYSKPNYVLLDSIMTAIMFNGIDIKKLDYKVNKLKENPEYKNIYEAKQGSLSVKNVNTRLALAISILK